MGASNFNASGNKKWHREENKKKGVDNDTDGKGEGKREGEGAKRQRGVG